MLHHQHRSIKFQRVQPRSKVATGPCYDPRMRRVLTLTVHGGTVNGLITARPFSFSFFPERFFFASRRSTLDQAKDTGTRKEGSAISGRSLTILTLRAELDKDIFSHCRKWTRKRNGVPRSRATLCNTLSGHGSLDSPLSLSARFQEGPLKRDRA